MSNAFDDTDVKVEVTTHVNHKLLKTSYKLISKHASRPMVIKVLRNGGVSVSGRATQNQLGKLIERVIQHEQRH